MRLTLNISPCPNDTFIFDALVNGRIDTEGIDFELHFEDIEELNSTAIAHGADICKVSCAVLPAIWRDYAIISSGAALGRGNGPLLVGADNIDLSKPVRVAIPGLHTTANLLMERIFPHITDKPCYLFSDIAGAVERGECEAGVLIHEGRFTYRDRGLTLLSDLGQQWESRYNLPLALGCIVVSRRLPREVRKKIERLIRISVEKAFAEPMLSRKFVKCHARELADSVIREHIDMFVNDFSVSLGRDGERAIRALSGLEKEDIFL